MTDSIELRHFLVNSVKNPYTKEDYYQIWYNGVLTGYINKDGIYLLMYHSKCPEGVWVNIDVWTEKSVREKVMMVQKHWSALYDRFTLRIKFTK